MTAPTEIDFVLVKMGDGAGSEVFTTICGIQDATINQTANSSDHFVRDCAAPGTPPTRKTKVSGVQLDVTGTGLSNSAEIVRLQAAVGKVKNYKLECYADDGTSGGLLLGTYAAPFRLTANNLNIPREGTASADITLASHGAWTYTAAP